MSTPTVHFPNLTANAHDAVKTLIALAYHGSRLPEKYRHVFHNLPAGRDWVVADDFAECFTKLAGLTTAELGEIPGVTMKYLIGDIATMLFRRAVQACESIQRLAQSSASAKQVEDCRELGFFAKDLGTLKAILDSRKAFIPGQVLGRYLELSESIVAYIRGNPEAEQLNRKIRAITRPRVVRPPATQPVVQVVAAPAIQVEVQDQNISQDQNPS